MKFKIILCVFIFSFFAFSNPAIAHGEEGHSDGQVETSPEDAHDHGESSEVQHWNLGILSDDGGYWLVKDEPFLATESHDESEAHDHSAHGDEADDDEADDDEADDDEADDDLDALLLEEFGSDPKAHHDSHPAVQEIKKKTSKIKIYFCAKSDNPENEIESFSILDENAPLESLVKVRGKFDGIKGKKRNLKLLSLQALHTEHSFEMTMLDMKSDDLLKMTFVHESGDQYSVSFDDGVKYLAVKKESRAALKVCRDFLDD